MPLAMANTTHTFDPTILREYDIRGTVDKNLSFADAAALGRAFGTMIIRAGGKKVMVGYDGRTHSPDFEAALVEGLLSTGCDVERIGLGPTPMLYFAVYQMNASAGIMVTGSHNPPDQNGFKMLIARNPAGRRPGLRRGDQGARGARRQGRLRCRPGPGENRSISAISTPAASRATTKPAAAQGRLGLR